MSPHRPIHSRYQSLIQRVLKKCLNQGEAIPECAIQTSAGVRVADVVWVQDEQLRSEGDVHAFKNAPMICIEVISSANSKEEIEEKKQLYFEAQAIEFWTCDLDGNVCFYTEDHLCPNSLLCPDFPNLIQLS